MAINTVIQERRKALGLTQEQVAEMLQVSAQTVSRWECGSTLPDAMTLPEIARLYGVTVDDEATDKRFGGFGSTNKKE